MMRTPFTFPECGRAGIELGMPGEIVRYHDRSQGYDLYNVLMACGCGAGCYTSVAIWGRNDEGKVPVGIAFDDYGFESTQIIFTPVMEVME